MTSLGFTVQVAAVALRDRLAAGRRARAKATGGHMPVLVLAGAQRCGTTSLALWLEANSIASPGSHKEIHYFDRHHHRGPDWYRTNFTSPRSFDATPAYLHETSIHGAMAAELPGSTRILVVLRDPLERAISQYRYQRRRRLEFRSLSTALAEEMAGFPGQPRALGPVIDRRYRYLERGRYADQLRSLFRHLGDHPIHVCDFGRLFGGDTSEMVALLDFLGVPSGVEVEAFPTANSSGGERPGSVPPGVREMFAAQDEELASLLGREMSWMGAQR